MRHLKAFDGEAHTVVMVQVENEIGMIPSARDHAPDATALFAGAVPAELMAYLQARTPATTPELDAAWRAAGARRTGTWTEVFGPGAATDEIFMAWHFARFTQQVTAAARRMRAADVRQRRADPARLSTGPVSERGAAAPPDRRLARGRPGHRHRAGHLLPDLRRVDAAVRPQQPLFVPGAAAPKPRRTRSTRSASTTRSASRRSPSRRSPARRRPCWRPATTCSRRSARSSPGIRATARWQACCRSTPTTVSRSRCA